MCIRFFFSLLAWLGLNSHRIISSDKDRGGFEVSVYVLDVSQHDFLMAVTYAYTLNTDAPPSMR